MRAAPAAVRAAGYGRVSRWVLGLIVWAALNAAHGAAARAADPDPVPPAPRPAAAPAVTEERPEIFYLQDAGGRLVPVPGFRYRDFLELFRLREGLPAALEPPAAVVESLVVRCDLARGDAAAGTCPATVECAVRQTRGGWARIPLGLDRFVIAGAPRHEGPGRAIVDADPDGGYRGWFDAPDGNGDARHLLVMEGTLPVELAAGRDTLALRLPAATAATVELRTSRDAPEVAVLPPPPGRPVVARGAAGVSTVTIAGVSGAIRIRLAAAGAGAADWEAVPESSVESVVRVDGRSAFIDAAIRLSNLRPGTRTIDVALPPRTTLRTVRPPATLVARGGTADAPTATIAIERGRDGAAVVDLECERPVDPAGEAAFEAVGFGVSQVESWRQWGRVSLVVDGDWRLEWTDRPGVRRVDPPPASRRPGFVAAFAYDAQPASLPVRVRPLVGRVVVEPEYRYDVGATRVALAARLRVVARGAPATALTLVVDRAFQIEDVGPPGVVDAAAVAVERGRVTIPFLQPLSGEAMIEVRCSSAIERDLARLEWQLPAPRADLVAPARVVVAADADIEILPDPSASLGLVRQVSGGRDRVAGEAAITYRMDGTTATFAATRRFLERRFDATIDATLRFDEFGTEVAETLRLDVAHVPLEVVEFTLPDVVVSAGSLEIRQDGTPLDPVVVAPVDDVGAAAGPPADAAAQVVRAVLAEPLLGTGELTVTFRVPTPPVPPQATVAADVPLAVPAEARIERQSFAVERWDRLTVEVRGEGWRADLTEDEAARAWTAARTQTVVPLALSARRRVAVDVVAEAAWLRTQVLADRREDVATYVLSGGGDGASIFVPAAADVVSCTIELDGTQLAAIRDAAGRFAVTLPVATAVRRRVLEVRTTTARPSGWAGLAARLGLPVRLRLDPPQFGARVAQRRFFWEIATRPDEHVFGSPTAWSPQQRWRLGRFGFERVSAVEPAALAAWIRAAAGSAVAPPDEPSLVESRTIYSGVGPPGAATVWLLPNWFAVLVASGVALAAGLAFAYVPAARRPAVVLPFVAIVGLAAAAMPDLAPLAAQAALPGVALSLVAWGLRDWLDRDLRRSGAAGAAPAVSASSLTRAIAPPSLVVAESRLGRDGSVTAGGRSSS